MARPFGVTFSRSRLRELSDEALHTATRRYLQAMVANPPPPAGTITSCMNDTEAVVRAGVVAKETMDKRLGAPYSRFVVHTLECQVTGSGMIYKAAVSATHPITGGRDLAHITFLNNRDGQQVDTSYDPNTLLGVAPDGAFYEDGNAEVTASGTSGSGGSDGGSEGGGIAGARRLQHAPLHHRRMQTTTSGTTYTVLDSTIVSGAPAPGDTSFNSAITNQDALKDPLVEILGVKASTALVVTAVVIVGSFLLALFIFVIYYVYTHWHIFTHLREHWHVHSKIKDLLHLNRTPHAAQQQQQQQHVVPVPAAPALEDALAAPALEDAPATLATRSVEDASAPYSAP